MMIYCNQVVISRNPDLNKFGGEAPLCYFQSKVKEFVYEKKHISSSF